MGHLGKLRAAGASKVCPGGAETAALPDDGGRVRPPQRGQAGLIAGSWQGGRGGRPHGGEGPRDVWPGDCELGPGRGRVV